MKIYTKNGDLGYTSLLNAEKRTIKKSDLRIDAFGNIDELNSWIGLITEEWTADDECKKTLVETQHNLLIIGSNLAIDPKLPTHFFIPNLPDNAIASLEQMIDSITEELPPLKNFVMPRGHKEISHIHITRTVCRRAERACAAIIDEHEKVKTVLPYINRLSDYLFVLARYKAKKLGVPEIKWLVEPST